MLKFIEERWGLRHLTARDHRANDMRDCFDFHGHRVRRWSFLFLPGEKSVLLPVHLTYPPYVRLPAQERSQPTGTQAVQYIPPTRR